MKLQVIGFEITEGTSARTGKPYSIGKLHTILPLSSSSKAGNAAKGSMGCEYRIEVGVLRKIEHLQPPFMADLESAEVMRFGKRETDIVAVVPIALVPDRKAA